MTITLELKPETERRLRRQAEQEGQEFCRYLAMLLDTIAGELEAMERDRDAAHNLR